MGSLPAFTPDGLLPPGTYELTLGELRASPLALGPAPTPENWDGPWRASLVNHLEVLVRQLWQVGVTGIYVDGSFVEDKSHPNDIDGYFECDAKRLYSGDLQRDRERTMIRNEGEYQEAVRRSQEERTRLADQEGRLKGMGLAPDEVQRAMDPIRSFHLQLLEEIDSYERLKRGDFAEIQNLHGLGIMLIGYRIALGFSQRELAEKLGVSESQVSRDERNEYHGITVERASRILDALKADLRSVMHPPTEVRPAA